MISAYAIRDLPFGTCAFAAVPRDDLRLPDVLHVEEAAFARALPVGRRVMWVAGRVALRAALEAVAAPTTDPILATSRGAPVVPAGFVGSISHKHQVAVAIAAPVNEDARATLGIDVEIPRAFRHDVSSRVLTPAELDAVAGLAPGARDREVLRRFSAKEAIYKALDPWVGRFVSFQEVEIETGELATMQVKLTLAKGDGPFVVKLFDASTPDEILIAARVTALPEYRPR